MGQAIMRPSIVNNSVFACSVSISPGDKSAVNKAPVPSPETVKFPVTVMSFVVVVPETSKLVNVPTLVMLGCAAVYTVPATNALAT